MSVCLATDNRLVSRTTMTRELQIAVDTFELTPTEVIVISMESFTIFATHQRCLAPFTDDIQQVRHLVLEGFKRSFYPGTYREKQQYMDAVTVICPHLSKESSSWLTVIYASCVCQIFAYYEKIANKHGVKYDLKYFNEEHTVREDPVKRLA